MNGWQLIQDLGIFLVITGGFSYVAKSVINNYFSKGLEAYKAQLQSNSQQEIESLKSALARTAYEHQIRFSRIYEKLAKVIEETHSNLVDLHRAASRFVTLYHINEEQRKDNRKALWDAADKFLYNFERHRIYLDQDVCQKITDLTEKLSTASAVLVNLIDDKWTDKFPETMLKEWEKGRDILEKEVPPIKALLTLKFQELLGVVTVREYVPQK